MSGTIIDRLVVELGLDPKKFGAGAKEAQSRLDKFNAAVKKLGIDESKLTEAQKKQFEALRRAATQAQRTTKELQSASSAGADFWDIMGKGAATFGVALSAVALKDMAQQAIQTNAAVSRISATLGMQAGEVDAWRKAVREATGSSGDGVFGTLQRVSDTLAGARFGNGFGDIPRIAALLSRASGGTPLPYIKSNGQPIDPEELLLSWADPIKKMGLQAAHALGTGLDDDTLQFLSKGRAADEAALAAARQNTLTPGGFAEADEAARATNKLSDAFAHLRDTLTIDAGPAIIASMRQVGSMVGLITGKLSWSEFQAQIQASSDEQAGPEATLKRKTDAALAYMRSTAADRPPVAGATAWTEAQRRTRLAQLFAQGASPETAARYVAMEEGRGTSAADAIGRGSQLAGQTTSGDASTESRILKGIEYVESRGNPNAVSAAGAQGLMQLMPGTWKDMKALDPSIGDNPLDPTANRKAGALYFHTLMERYHDYAKAIAGYFAGPGGDPGKGQFSLDQDIAGHGDQWRKFLPTRTSAYLDAVIGASGGSFQNGEMTINQNGPVTINVPNGDPNTIAKGWHKSVVAQAQTGPQ